MVELNQETCFCRLVCVQNYLLLPPAVVAQLRHPTRSVEFIRAEGIFWLRS